MPINLLPEEMREEEKKQPVEKAEEKPEVEMTRPVSEKPFAKEKVSLRQSPGLKGWFGFKKKARPRPEVVPPQKKEVKPSPIVPRKKPLEIPPALPVKEKVVEPTVPVKTPEEKPVMAKIPELAEMLVEEEKKPLPEKSKTKVSKKSAKKIILEKVDGSPEITLMPKKALIIPRVIRERMLMLIAVIIVVLTVFSVVWLYANWHFEKLRVEMERIKVDRQLLEVETAPFLKIRDQIASLERKSLRAESILVNHIYWTKFFNLLETYTIPEVFFGDFSADTNGTVELSATGKDLLSIARQIVVFANAPDFIKETSVSNITKSPMGISCSFGLILVDDVFKK